MELNGSPYFQALVLDQGYWPRTGITPPSADSLKQDIILAKRMGFNGCRKHQKVEDPIFLYWADILGFLVWGEMANAYEFNDTYMERFNDEWISAVKRDINHPCIVTWTPVNESWGYDDLPGSAQQRNHLRSLYFMTR
jgi:beta-galactosidase/beta-glucuronidase